jgi:phytoene dehydrogenase-like protein
MMKMNKFDVVVVGGGLTGLTASIYLAEAGLSVVLIEKAKSLGGKASTVNKKGALINMGVHALYHGGVTEEILNELNVKLEGNFPSQSGASASIIWNNKVYKLPTNLSQFISAQLFTFSEKIEMVHIMMKLRKINTERLGAISLKEWAEKEISKPTVRNVIYSISRANSFVPYPELHLAGPAIRQLQRTFNGQGFYVDNGWGQIIDKLKEKAIGLGVTIIRKNVIEIIHDKKVQQICFADGTTMDTNTVLVSAGGLKETCKLIKEVEKTSLQKWYHESHPIIAACLDIVLRQLPDSSRDFVAGFWIDQPIFFNNPTLFAKHGREDVVIIHVTKHLGSEDANPTRDKQELEHAMDTVHPRWREEEIDRQFLPRITVTHDFCSVDKFGRILGPEVPEIEGLYVAGDWTENGEMLTDAVFASARRAARTIIQSRNEAITKWTQESSIQH